MRCPHIRCHDDERLTESIPCDPWAPSSETAEFLPPVVEHFASYVRPFIGSMGAGNVIPRALVSHGMVRVSPETNAKGGAMGGYHGEDKRNVGFTHTHLEGPGGSANGYSEVFMRPGVGTLPPLDASSAYSHGEQKDEPGYRERP